MVKTTAVIAATLLAAHAFAHEDDAKAASGQALGKVSFATSCSETVQPQFERGVAHAAFVLVQRRPRRRSRRSLAQDPRLRHRELGHRRDPHERIRSPGRARRRRAPSRRRPRSSRRRRIGAKTQRERDYIEAVAAYYEDFATAPERERQQAARRRRTRALAASYPDDDEAQIFYALYTRRHADAGRPDLRGLPQGRRDPREAVREVPRPSRRRALPDPQLRRAADRRRRASPPRARYATIAPAAPHALHMPSHIFTRVGAWEDSVATNRALEPTCAQGRQRADEA